MGGLFASSSQENEVMVDAGTLMTPTAVSDDANMCAPAAVIIACEGILTYQKLKYIKTISKK